MEFLIITGLSGAGKSRAADVCEDLDYYCVDNLPAALMTRFAELCLATRGRYEKVALVMDSRSAADCRELTASIDELTAKGLKSRILYVEADTPTLVNRYKESRRPHPLAQLDDTIVQAVEREKEFLAPLRDRADFIVDTSHMTLGRLQEAIGDLLEPNKSYLRVNVTSFGFKYGIPTEADLVFDVRCLPNPYYEADLKDLSGLDKPVSDFIFRFENAQKFLEKLLDLITFLLPQYLEEGRHVLNIAVGCTGGRHRSVAMAKALADGLKDRGCTVRLVHRDLSRGSNQQ
jgi:UPF0042 nucleotide-binding protein